MAINVKDLGAKGDGNTDDYQIFKDALSTGETVYVPFGIYRIEYQSDDKTPTLTLKSGCHLIGDGMGATRITFVKKLNDYKGAGLSVENRQVKNIGLHNISFQGTSNAQRPVETRVFGIGLSGENIQIENCRFNAFRTHMLSIGGGDPTGNWIENAVYNSHESVKNLLATSANKVIVTGCYFENAESNCFTSFGVNNLIFSNNNVDGTGALNALFIDDATTHWLLENYRVNDNITISDNIFMGHAHITGAARCLIANNLFKEGRIAYFSYDFNQQLIGIRQHGEHPEPFFHLNYLPRNILIQGNICKGIWIRSGGYVNVSDNNVISAKDNEVLFHVQGNGIRWGTENYFDGKSKFSYSSYTNIYTNLFSAAHSGIKGIATSDKGAPVSTIHNVVNNIFTTSNEGSFDIEH